MDNHTPLPKSWEELMALAPLLKDADREYLRNSDENRDYSAFRRIIPKELQVALMLEQIGDNASVLLINRYPYSRLLSYLPNVVHYSLWNKEGELTEEEIEKAVTEKFPDKKWVAVESAVKSLPEIWHTHVFVEK